MKKTIVLMTIVLAILAAPVFAEVTASGEVEYSFGYNGDIYSEGTGNEIEVDLGGTVGDYTSISATLSSEEGADMIYSVNEDYDPLDEESEMLTAEPAAIVYLDSMVLTQDITGALGVDAPVSVSMSMGIDSFGPTEYQDVAGYGDFEYGFELDPGTIMTKFSLGVQDMVTIDVALYEPGMEVFSDALQFGMNAYGTFGMVDASVSFLKMTEDISVVGFNAAAAPIDGLTVGAGLEMELNDGESFGTIGAGAAYTIDALTAGVAFVTKTSSVDTGLDFTDVSSLAFNVVYGVSEAADVFAGVIMPDLAGNADMGYEAGAAYTLDGVTYSAGYTYASDFKAYDAEAEDGNVFIKVAAEF